MRKLSMTGLLILLSASLLALAVNVRPTKAGMITVPDDYLAIQEAINSAADGDTVFVRSGTYYERVVVNKSVALLGESRDTTIICGEADYNDVVAIIAGNVSISGFTIQNGAQVNVVLKNCSGCTISGNVIKNSNGGLVLHGSHLNLISDNLLLNNLGGSYFDYSHNNTVKGNLVKLNNNYGIYLVGSDFNKIIENNIAENGNYWPDAGLTLYENSEGNSIYHNNFPYNWVYNARGNTTENCWDNGCEGNYWWDYQGTDSNSDGIGDTPYTAPLFGEDKYPLMNPYWNPADVNHDLKVDIYDVVLVGQAYDSVPSDTAWNPHCDIAEPYGVIDIYDIVLVCDCYDEEYSS